MEPYLQVEALTKSVGDRMLFSDVTFGITEGDKIGIVAKNGTGKTTLLNIISGKDTPDSGKVTLHSGVRVGMLEQLPEFAPEATVIEAALSSAGDVAAAVLHYEQATSKGNAAEIAEAAHALDRLNAWDFEDRTRQLLTSLHITDMNQPVKELSGGQRKRVALASTLISQPELLILDEPTNHLDIEIIEWLENYLSRQRITLLMVTHDRYFLDRVCNKIIELDREQAYFYEGNYDYYLRRRAERIEAFSQQLERDRNILRKEQDWMSRQPQARAGKARYRINQFFELKDRTKVNLEEKNVVIASDASYIGSKIFEAHHVSKRFGDKVIVKDFSYTFARYDKVGLVGVNGVGKSTFIKMLQGLMTPDSGTFDVGSTVRFGYYSQDGIQFNENKKVIDAVTEIAEDIELKEGIKIAPMQYLQKFLFSVPDQQKYISTLSGGEKSRLHLATVLMRRPNFLILDEPTNDLDIVTLGILEEHLAEFKGCVLVVSHDRYFLDNIVDHLFIMTGDGTIKDFPGNYIEYREAIKEREKARNTEKKAEAKKETVKSYQKERARKLSFKEKKELESLETELELLNKEKAEIEAVFNSGNEISDIENLSKRYNAIKEEIDTKELRWLTLSEIDM